MLDVLARADARGLFDPADRAASHGRVARLRARLAKLGAPDPEVVGCAEHRALARELADRSITLVRNEEGLLPVRADAGRVAVVSVRPADLTPADTSSTVAIELADAIGLHHREVDGFETSHPPMPNEIADLRGRAASYDLVVVGTLDAKRDPRQSELVTALLGAGPPVVWAALRTPWDLLACPNAPTYVCSYGIHRPSVEALAGALWGRIPFRGRLPVQLDARWPRGHGLVDGQAGEGSER